MDKVKLIIKTENLIINQKKEICDFFINKDINNFNFHKLKKEIEYKDTIDFLNFCYSLEKSIIDLKKITKKDKEKLLLKLEKIKLNGLELIKSTNKLKEKYIY